MVGRVKNDERNGKYVAATGVEWRGRYIAAAKVTSLMVVALAVAASDRRALWGLSLRDT